MNGQARICGDYKCTISKEAKTDKYRLPYVEYLYVKLANGCFTKLDLNQACLLLPPDRNVLQLSTPQRVYLPITNYPLMSHQHQAHFSTL